MYWPVNAVKVLSIPRGLSQNPTIAIRPNRRGNLFASLSKDGLGVWEIRPTVFQASVVRDKESLERWGENVDVVWSYDGRGLIILTSTSHLLVYQLVSTGQPLSTRQPPPSFPPGVGAGEGDELIGWTLKPLGAAFMMGGITFILPQPHALMFGLKHPPSMLTVPWPIPTECLTPPASHFPPNPLDGGGTGREDFDHWDTSEGAEWIEGSGETAFTPTSLSISRTQGLPVLHALTMADGRAYAMYLSQQVAQYNQSPADPSTPGSRPSPSALPPHQAPSATYFSQKPKTKIPKYTGDLIHPLPDPDIQRLTNGTEALGFVEYESVGSNDVQQGKRAEQLATNSRFSLVAIGTDSGIVDIISVPFHPQQPRKSHTLDLKHAASLRVSPGAVRKMAWTSDGYALAVGYEHGWAVWSVGGRLGGWGLAKANEDEQPKDGLTCGVKDLFWGPGNLELFALSDVFDKNGRKDQIYVIPFTKSATTTQHSPDNTRYAFLQMDDRVLVYRGADQPDMSVINPEADAWEHIKIPELYIATNWPIRYASISSDGKLIAVAGRRGLTHYSAASGRWKLFEDERLERDFVVRGGLLWFHHVLIAAVDVDRSHQIRLYSRDCDLNEVDILHSQSVPAPILAMSLLDNSLLVYTAENTLYHFLIVPSETSTKLHLCGSISFAGVVHVPTRVRALSWLIPPAQKELGDPADDLIVATIIFLVDGKLVLLRPRRAGNEEVRYDLQVLADRIESYWTHLHGLGTLENSLWGFDGSGMRVWLDALTIEATKVDTAKDAYEIVKESLNIRLDFHPLSILMDKGIIIGVDHEMSSRSLPFSLFKIQTGTHLFLPQFLRYHLSQQDLTMALTFAVNYSSIIYFGHSLEILLHSVLEDEVDSGTMDILPSVVDFLDHFPESLDVVVGCARKTEVDRWEMLFKVVGPPRELFEMCLKEGMLKTAAGYLLVLQNLEELDDIKDTVRILRLALAAKDLSLCRDVLRFLQSIDDTGAAVKAAADDVGLSLSEIAPEFIIKQDEPPVRVLPVLQEPDTPQPGSVQLQTLSTSEEPDTPRIPAPQAGPPRPPLLSAPSSNSVISGKLTPHSSQLSESSTPSSYPYTRTPSPGLARVQAMRAQSSSNGSSPTRIASPFDLSSPRMWTSPPSPMTVDMVPDQPTVPTPPPVPSPGEEVEAEQVLR